MISKILDLFKKKSDVISPQEDIHFNDKKTDTQSLCQPEISMHRLSPSELAPEDVLMLHYACGAKVGKMQFAGFWNYLYEVNPHDILKKLVVSGLIIESFNIEQNLNSSTVAELKEILKTLGLPLSGNKKTLTARLIDSVPKAQLQELFPTKTYDLSDIAKQILKENDHVPFFHAYSSRINISIYEAHKLKKKNPSDNKFQIAHKILIDRKHTHKANNDWGLFRNDILGLSEIQYIEGIHLESLKNLFLVCFYDLSGMGNNFNLNYINVREDNFFPYEDSFYTLAPGIISKICSLQKKLNLDADEFHQLYFQIITPIEVPFHLFTKEETYKILLLEIEKDTNSLKKIYSSAKLRYKDSKKKK